MRCAIGVDVGATHTRVALADEQARIIDRVKFRTPTFDRLAVASEISSSIQELMRRNGVSKGALTGIGVGSIGPLDVWRGIIVKAANLPLENVPIVEPLQQEFDVPTFLVNDCVAAVIGERHLGAGRGHENLVYITISTGIGGGVYVDGHLLLGKDGNAHEIGHTVVDAEGKLVCGCGKRGHWEAYSSGSGIPKLAKLIAEREPSLFRGSSLARVEDDPLKLTAKDIYEAARAEDEFARAVVEVASRYNAMGVANVVNVYDPSLVTMGGSVTLNNVELVVEPIRRMISEYAVNRLPEIAVTSLGEDVGIYGAIALALSLETLPTKSG